MYTKYTATLFHDHHDTGRFEIVFCGQEVSVCLSPATYTVFQQASAVHETLLVCPPQSISVLSLALLKLVVSVFPGTLAPRLAIDVERK